MKNSKSLLSSAALVGALLSLASFSASAAVVTWGGGSGDYATGANWVGGGVPNTNGGDTALINSGNAVYTPGGDLAIHGGGALTVSGGSWTQTGGIAWIQAGGGSINVSGGTFNQGTAQNIILSGSGALNVSSGVFNQSTGSGFERNGTSTISVSGGTANFAGNFLYNPTNLGTFSITGGTVNVGLEFKPIANFTMTTGVLTCRLISFADGPGSITLTGGLITVNGGGAYSGFYGGGSQGVNFTTGSTGTLFFENYTEADLLADNFMTNGTIKYNGLASAGSFTLTELDGGVYVALTTVPEPGSLILACGGLGTVLFFRRRNRA